MTGECCLCRRDEVGCGWYITQVKVSSCVLYAWAYSHAPVTSLTPPCCHLPDPSLFSPPWPLLVLTSLAPPCSHLPGPCLSSPPWPLASWRGDARLGTLLGGEVWGMRHSWRRGGGGRGVVGLSCSLRITRPAGRTMFLRENRFVDLMRTLLWAQLLRVSHTQ